MIIKILSIVTLLTLNIFAQSVYHNGYMYHLVKSKDTGAIWLDKNIGATRVCEDYDDEQCFGDLFQWGRNADGHEKDTYIMTKTQAQKISHLDYPFIISTKKNNRDWAKRIDKDGKKRQVFWKKVDGKGICPFGFRVPTIEELEKETINTGEILDNESAFESFLKLPSAGYRSSADGILLDRGSRGHIWSSSIDEVYSEGLYFSKDRADTYTYNRADAMSVRCIKSK